MKNLLIVINSLKAGGAERVVSILCNSLHSKYNIHLMLLENEIEFDINPKVKIIKLNQSFEDSIFLKYLKLPITAFQLNQYCKKNNIDISLSFLSRSNYINVFSKFYLKKYKIIISERTYISEYLKQISILQQNISKFLIRFLYTRADYILSNSREALLDLKNTYKINVPSTVIQNPLPIQNINKWIDESVEYEFKKDIFYFVHVGKLRKEKNHLMLLNAIKLLSFTNQNIKLLIIGEGEEFNKITAIINKLEIKDFVDMLGLQKNPYKFINRSNCLVLNSNFEGLPNVILEGLACKKPIISTDCKSGPREILYDEFNSIKNKIIEIEIADYGILVPVGDSQQLFLAMKKMIENKSMYDTFCKTAYNRALQFDTDAILIQYENLLNQI